MVERFATSCATRRPTMAQALEDASTALQAAIKTCDAAGNDDAYGTSSRNASAYVACTSHVR